MPWSGRTFIIIRHGETDWNKIGRLQGQRDIPLNDTGRRQARRNGFALAEYLAHIGRRPDEFTWYASPLARTRETLQLVRTSMGLSPDRDPPEAAGLMEPEPGSDLSSIRHVSQTAPLPCHFDDRLKEFNFGDWEGEILNDLKKKAPDQYRARRQDKWNFQPPGGESYEMLMQRVLPWLENTTGDLITVTHGGVVRVLWHLLEKHPKHSVTEQEVIQEKVYVFRDGTLMNV